MRSLLLLALPLALVVGCGSASPLAASPDQPPTAGNGAVAAPSAEPSPLAAGAVPAADANKKAGEASASGPPAPGRAVASDAPILSKITQDDILALVNKNMDIFNRCYALGAGTSKSYRAKVTVKATVSPTGTVTVVEVINSTAKNPKVDACVSDGFKKLTFERPKGSGATVFTFPLSFDGIVQVP